MSETVLVQLCVYDTTREQRRLYRSLRGRGLDRTVSSAMVAGAAWESGNGSIELWSLGASTKRRALLEARRRHVLAARTKSA